WRR
ncbi:exodeoxyribonuclease V, 67 kDa subunit domain protein, partial [Vibrio cholerae O1 str. NHCC-010F]